MKAMSQFVITWAIFMTVFIGLSTCTRMAMADSPITTYTLPEDTLVFRSDFSDQSAASFTTKLMKHKGDTVVIWLDSPGGSVFALDQMLTTVKAMRKKIICVTSFSASASFMFFQAGCDERIVQPNSVLMHHQASTVYRGEVNRIESFKKLIDGMLARLDDAVAKRLKLTRKELNARTADEWWLQGEEAVKQGAADRMAFFTCSPKMIAAEYEEEIQVFIFTIKLTWSKCPLITYPTKINDMPQFDRPVDTTSPSASVRFWQHKEYYLKDAMFGNK